MKSLEKLINSMPVESDIYGNKVKPTAFIGEDDFGRNRIMLSAEHENSYLFADYYGDYRGGFPWVHPALEAWAKKHGFFWEWQNPGALMLCKI